MPTHQYLHNIYQVLSCVANHLRYYISSSFVDIGASMTEKHALPPTFLL